jgi:DegV family protein with EDD domain
MPRVGIVTDSTCDLHPTQLEAMNVKMVPLKVLFGEESSLDWIELEPAEFYERLSKASTLPKTSQPAPADFKAAYEELAAQGCESIVSIHISSKLSGTIGSAEVAAADAPVPVHIVDTKKVSQALGLIVQAACDARDEGMNGQEVADYVTGISAKTRLFFVLNTLDNLVKGGRAGKAAGLAASLLDIKPVLDVNAEGIIEPFKKVKGRKKALAALAEHVAQDSKDLGRLRLALLHGCDEDGLAMLRAELDKSGADVDIVTTGLVGAVVGTYVAVGALGCAYYPID